MAHGRVSPVVAGGAVAGIVAAAVLTFIRVDVCIIWYVIVSAVVGSPHAEPARRALSEIWVALKIAAYPFVGERALAPGFDARVVLLGVVSHLSFSICVGVLFGLVAHGHSRSATVALGLLCGVAMWGVSSYVVFPPILKSGGTLIEFIPYGLALAGAFLWYQRRFSPRVG
jgi:uncharacterized membrane protein YagU involved in acid resistance